MSLHKKLRLLSRKLVQHQKGISHNQKQCCLDPINQPDPSSLVTRGSTHVIKLFECVIIGYTITASTFIPVRIATLIVNTYMDYVL